MYSNLIRFYSFLFFSFSLPNETHTGFLSDSDIDELIKMHKLCRQVSIESPGSALKDCVFSFVVPVRETTSVKNMKLHNVTRKKSQVNQINEIDFNYFFV